MNVNIERINELARKSRTPEGLTEAEIAEQVQLRAEYVAAMRKNLKAQLDRIDVLEPDGTVTHLKDTYNEKKKTES